MKCPSQIPDHGSFCIHFHEFSLDDRPGFYCDGDIKQMNQAVLGFFSPLVGLVVGPLLPAAILWTFSMAVSG